jgi:feruloyl esterase
VIAVAPAMRVSEGATIAAAWTVQKFLSVAPMGGDGQPVLARALSDAQLQRVAREVLDRCDTLDGLKDGLVNDVGACRIDPAALQCPAGGPATDGCLSTRQADTLAAVMAGPRNSHGPLYTGWAWDPGMADPGWRAWTLGTAQQGAPNARHVTLMAGALGHEFVTPPDPKLSTLNFDFERDPARMQAFHAVYDTADDVRLAGWRQRGGKLMFFHGMADPIFSPLELVDYQQRLNAAHGARPAAQWARSFLVPGMTHCAGGPATDAFDGLGALVKWVEQGEAPERVIARGTGTLPATTQRPLCPWPQVARYGSGDVNRAESFACR